MESLGQIYNPFYLIKFMFSHRNLSSNSVVSPGQICTFVLGNRVPICQHSECTQVVKVNPKGNSKTTLERNWFYFKRGISQYIFNKTRYKPTLKDLYRWLKQHITIGKWSRIHTKISQRHIHEIYQRQDNHFITVIHLVQVKQKRQ